MKADEFEKEFLAMSEKEQTEILRKILPVFCRNMMRDPGKTREKFSRFAEECCGPMADMAPNMGRMGRNCCGLPASSPSCAGKRMISRCPAGTI